MNTMKLQIKKIITAVIMLVLLGGSGMTCFATAQNNIEPSKIAPVIYHGSFHSHTDGTKVDMKSLHYEPSQNSGEMLIEPMKLHYLSKSDPLKNNSNPLDTVTSHVQQKDGTIQLNPIQDEFVSPDIPRTPQCYMKISGSGPPWADYHLNLGKKGLYDFKYRKYWGFTDRSG